MLRQVLNGEKEDDDFLFVTMSSNRLRDAYQSQRVSVGEWPKSDISVQEETVQPSGN